MASDTFRCWLVERTTDESVASRIAQLDTQSLPRGDVLIEVEYSSLNYKDLLAAQGHPGIVKTLPHIPGIDAAGRVLQSTDPRFSIGSSVIVTGYGLGQSQWGGWGQRIRVPAAWVVPLPAAWSTRQAMQMGTAGFTAAQCVMALQRHGVEPSAGEVVVTGATGGVGCLSVRLLVKLGYAVVAVTGKASEHQRLLESGAARVLSRDELLMDARRPLQSARWSGGVDTVGGEFLTHLLRQTQYGGAVAACGLVAGADLNTTLYPFLLRGVALCGVASADCPYDRRREVWERLSGAWGVELPAAWDHEIGLDGLQSYLDKMRHGRVSGRVVVKL
jgi:acrylyl-CoA reductase (NADPH)